MSNDIHAADKALNEAILAGDALAAFETYYADTVSMQENDQSPTVGKDANREREKAFFSAVTALREIKLLKSAVDGDTSFSLWFYDYDHAEWGTRAYHQVAVRTWRDGKVVKEAFYYGS